MKNRLSKRELDIMDVLWASQKPMSANDILLSISDITMNTIQPNLKKLMKKGFIEVSGVGYTKNSITRQFSPLITQAEYVAHFLNSNALKALACKFVDEAENESDLMDLKNKIKDKIHTFDS